MPSVHPTRPATQPTFNPYGLVAIRIPIGLLVYPRLSAGAKLLYGRLALHRGRKPDGHCNPSLDALAQEMGGVHTNTIERWLQELVRESFIMRKRRQQRNAECVFLAHACLSDSPNLVSQDREADSPNLVSQETSRFTDSGDLESPILVNLYKEENRHLKHTTKTCASDDAQMCVASQLNGRAASDSRRRVTPIGSGMTKQQESWFSEWWDCYWRHNAKKAAREMFRKHVRTEARFQQVLTATEAQAPAMMAREPQHRPQGATWLNDERWEDEPDQPSKLPPRGASSQVFYPVLKTISEREREK